MDSRHDDGQHPRGKTHLSRLLARVEAGESITIAKAGRPIVDLVLHVAEPVTFGTLDASWTTADDAFSDETDTLVEALFGADAKILAAQLPFVVDARR